MLHTFLKEEIFIISLCKGTMTLGPNSSVSPKLPQAVADTHSGYNASSFLAKLQSTQRRSARTTRKQFARFDSISNNKSPSGGMIESREQQGAASVLPTISTCSFTSSSSVAESKGCTQKYDQQLRQYTSKMHYRYEVLACSVRKARETYPRQLQVGWWRYPLLNFEKTNQRATLSYFSQKWAWWVEKTHFLALASEKKYSAIQTLSRNLIHPHNSVAQQFALAPEKFAVQWWALRSFALPFAICAFYLYDVVVPRIRVQSIQTALNERLLLRLNDSK